MARIDPFLEELVRLSGSDLHLSAGRPPCRRIHGVIGPIDNEYPLTGEQILDLLREIAPAANIAELERCGDTDFAYEMPGVARFRVNGFRDMNGYGTVLRVIPEKIPTFEELNLPSSIRDFCMLSKGLIVVTGPTGSGKSTTLSAMIDHINRVRNEHIITIEDPIEFLHTTDRCLVNQRQVGRDTRSFNAALIDALREDPDVILVGEIRDIDTIRTALRAAETGHLVFTTLHAGDCAGAVERLISVFPADEQSSARHQLALVLRGIFAQHLLPKADKTGRVPAYELLVNTAAVANLIATGRTAQIYSLLETNSALGMCTLEKSLTDLVLTGKIPEQTALAFSRNAEALKRRIDRHA